MNASKFAAEQEQEQGGTRRSWMTGVVLAAAAALAIVGCSDDKKKGGDPCAEDPFTYGCPNNPCIADPTLAPCIANPCLANPALPGCGDPCLTNPTLPQCQVIDPCVANPTLPQCGGDPCVANPSLPQCQTGPVTPHGTLTITGLADWNGQYVFAFGGFDGELGAAASATLNPTMNVTLGLVSGGQVTLGVYDMYTFTAIGNRATSFYIVSHTAATLTGMDQVEALIDAKMSSGQFKTVIATFVNSVATGVALEPGTDPCDINPNLPECQLDYCDLFPELCDDDVTIPPATSTPMTVGAWTNGNIAAPGGEQWFSFTATASLHYIHFNPGANLTDIFVDVYSSTGDWVDYKNLYDDDLSFHVTVTPGQTYYVLVDPYYDFEYGPYQLAVTTTGILSAPPALSKSRAVAPSFASVRKAAAKAVRGAVRK